MSYDFVFISILFFATSLLGIFYYNFIPSREELQKRLPNKPSIEAAALTLLIAYLIWQIISEYEGLLRFARIGALVMSLLLFEFFFLLLMRWIQKNWLNAFISMALVSGAFLLHNTVNSFATFNVILILAVLGGTALLIRSSIIPSRLVLFVALLWMPYDYYYVTQVLPKFTRAASDPTPFFAYPAVTIGTLSLGLGDFAFLALFTYVLIKQFSQGTAYLHAILQGIGLFVVAYIVSVTDVIVPFMLVLSPIFFLVYFVSHMQKKSNYL